jgi:hypothetical protein
MFRHLAAGLFVEWCSRDPKRHRATMTDFHAAMDAEQTRVGVRFVTSRSSSFMERS